MLRTLVKVIALLGPEIRWEDIVEEASKELAQGDFRPLAQYLLIVIFVCPLSQVLANDVEGLGTIQSRIFEV